MKRLLTLCSVLGLLVGVLAFAPTASATVEVCTTFAENTNGGGDLWSFCTTWPGGAGVSNFATHTNNLTGGGCNNGTGGQNPNWDNCISSYHPQSTPAGVRVRFYAGTSYTGTPAGCYDGNGTPGGFLAMALGDAASSFRYESGDCP